MQSISNLASGVSKAVWGESSTQQQPGEEPISGETGKGTATEPFDAGNKPEQEQKTTTATNPTPSGPSTTISTPAPATTLQTSATDRPTNARSPSFALKETATGSVADPSSASVQDDQFAAAVKPLEEPTSDAIVKDDTNPNDVIASANKEKNAAYDTPSTFDDAKKSASDDSRLLRAERTRDHSPERSISPGARPDGTHAETGKPEKSKLSSKLKGKFHIGSSKH